MTVFTTVGMLLNLPFVCLVGFVPMMFDSATVGFFAHHRGGIKALVVSCIAVALSDVFLAGIAACIIGFDVYGGVGFQVDNAITLSAFSPLWKYLGWAGYALVLVIMLAIPQIQYLKNKKGYWLAAEDWEQYKEVMGEDL